MSGNNGLGTAAITPDRYNARFGVTVGAGQTIGLLNFAFLAEDANGTSAADAALAQQTGLALLAAPRLDGLSTTQVASIANFTVAAAPEPGTWALMILGVGMIGADARRRRRRRSFAAA